MTSEWEERITKALEGVNPSSTSTTKFDPLREAIAELVDVQPAEIYAAGVRKDFRVRFEQSDDARERRVGVAVTEDTEWIEKSIAPAGHQVELGRKELVIFVAPDSGGAWRVARVVGRAGSPLSARVSKEFPGVTIEDVPVSSSGDARSSGSVERRDSPEMEFTPETFSLLAELQATPTVVFFSPRREEFRQLVQDPFHVLFERIVARLPATIADRMETRSRLYSRFVKNDYGRGGVWPYYWSAVYAGADRINGVQLFQWINHDRLVFGFSIGEYATPLAARFNANRLDRSDELVALLSESLGDERLNFGAPSETLDASRTTWADWLADTSAVLTCGIVLDAVEVLESSQEKLAELGYTTFLSLFPLVLLAIEDDPIPAIAAYLETSEPIANTNPSFSIADVAAATGLARALLERWDRAIERHKQAILYGPPGTGKTFVAKFLARHLIADGDGFSDLVQFHPAYSYEDFVQGIRPRPRSAEEGGGLDYPVTPGRFQVFCEEARRRSGLCVMIIDEINRANLARVFGELMYLLEYRDASSEGGKPDSVPLATGGRFGIPSNVRLIGTMNTADRSIALLTTLSDEGSPSWSSSQITNCFGTSMSPRASPWPAWSACSRS